MGRGEPLEVEYAGDEWCPVTATAVLIGKKWHPVIVDRLLRHGPLGFNDLESAVGGISSKVLSASLADLEDRRLVDREVVTEKPVRVEYSLTERGESLRLIVHEMREWGSEHLVPAGESRSSIL